MMGSASSPDRHLFDAVLRIDLASFIRASFAIVSPGDGFIPNWHIEAIAYALERVLRGETKRLIINVPPRSLKSICCSVAYVAYILGHDPTRQVVCVSYSEVLARKHANDCRALMRSAMYRRLWPATHISSTKDTELEFMTSKRGYRLSTSVGGTLTGRGGNLIIIDDPLKPQEAYSEPARERLRQWYGNTLLSRLNNKAEDAIIIVQQRVHMDDLVGHVLERENWTVLSLPAIAEVEEEIPIGPNRVHVRKPGDVLHPEREPLPVLDEIRLSMGTMDFAAQYQQEPVPPGGNLIDWEWFRVYDTPPAMMPGDRIIVSWDTAMSPREFSDYSACVILQVRGETVYVLDVIRERLEFPDLRRKIIGVHSQWRQAAQNYSLLVENKGSGMSLVQDLRGEGIHAVAVDPEGDKIMRVHAQTARIEGGAVHLPRRALWLDELRREILAFPHGRYDDQVDALSQGLDRAFHSRSRQIWFSSVRGLH